MISASQVKQLRDKTSLSVIECKKALETACGDETKALEILTKLSREKSAGKSHRKTGQGIVEAYVHSNGKIGVILQLFSETDFVASNQSFKDLAHDIALHIAAADPSDIQELLKQPFIKNPDKTIEDLVNEQIAKLGENIKIGEFVKLKI